MTKRERERIERMPEKKRKERKPERPVREHWMRWYSLMEEPDGEKR